MANRQRGFGMTAELNRKREAKFDVGLANDCFEWMKLVLIDGGFQQDADQLPVNFFIPINYKLSDTPENMLRIKLDVTLYEVSKDISLKEV